MHPAVLYDWKYGRCIHTSIIVNVWRVLHQAIMMTAVSLGNKNFQLHCGITAISSILHCLNYFIWCMTVVSIYCSVLGGNIRTVLNMQWFHLSFLVFTVVDHYFWDRMCNMLLYCDAGKQKQGKAPSHPYHQESKELVLYDVPLCFPYCSTGYMYCIYFQRNNAFKIQWIHQVQSHFNFKKYFNQII